MKSNDVDCSVVHAHKTLLSHISEVVIYSQAMIQSGLHAPSVIFSAIYSKPRCLSSSSLSTYTLLPASTLPVVWLIVTCQINPEIRRGGIHLVVSFRCYYEISSFIRALAFPSPPKILIGLQRIYWWMRLRTDKMIFILWQLHCLLPCIDEIYWNVYTVQMPRQLTRALNLSYKFPHYCYRKKSHSQFITILLLKILHLLWYGLNIF